MSHFLDFPVLVRMTPIDCHTWLHLSSRNVISPWTDDVWRATSREERLTNEKYPQKSRKKTRRNGNRWKRTSLKMLDGFNRRGPWSAYVDPSAPRALRSQAGRTKWWFMKRLVIELSLRRVISPFTYLVPQCFRQKRTPEVHPRVRALNKRWNVAPLAYVRLLATPS